MTLEDRIGDIEALTEALRAAVAAGDEPACAPLLQRRGQALLDLDTAVNAAGESERAALGPRLGGLVEADRALRTAAATVLAQAGDAVRSGFGLHGRMGGSADREPGPVSLDRRA
jgi:hypothetical protein